MMVPSGITRRGKVAGFQRLGQLIPQAVTEVKSGNKIVKRKVYISLLREALNNQSFPRKRESRLLIFMDTRFAGMTHKGLFRGSLGLF